MIRRVLRALDWRIALPAIVLYVAGVVLVWSSTRGQVGDTGAYLSRQIGYGVAGLVLMVALACVSRWSLRAWSVPVYVVACLGVALVLTPLGVTVNGSRSWLGLAGLQFQPSEPAKLALVLALAALFGSPADAPGRSPAARLPAALGIAAVPVGLVMLQPDLGTALILGAITAGMLVLAGVPWRWITLLAVGAAGAGVLAWRLRLLKPHQVERLLSFADPQADPQGSGYNALQALETVGSGGLTGRGLFRGDQTGGHFVPEQHTDFIFTVAGEELGFLGTALLLVLLWAIMWRGLQIAMRAGSPYERLVAGGIVCWFAAQSAINVGMVLGLAPVVGVPLPLLSYGGSATLTCLAAAGILMAMRPQGRLGEVGGVSGLPAGGRAWPAG